MKIVGLATWLVLSLLPVRGQNTALSGTASNSCSAGNAGTNNTSLGCNAGFNLTGSAPSSGQNVLLGYQSGYNLTHEVHNTFIGYKSGYSTGYGVSEWSNIYNTFVGSESGYSNIFGYYNSYFGYRSGYSNVNGTNNTAIGIEAGYFSDGSYNTYVGDQAGKFNSGSGNNCSYNSVVGFQAGAGSTGSSYTYNSLFGYHAGRSLTSGSQNSIMGSFAGYSLTTGLYNVFIGNNCGYSTTTAGSNVFVGYEAGDATTTGGTNVFVGYQAGDANTTGTANTILGYSADLGSTGLNNATAIGANAIVRNSNHFILGDNNVNVGIGLSNDATGPLSDLSIGGSGSAAITTYSFSNLTSDGAIAIKGEINAPSSTSSNKVYGSVGIANANHGYSYGMYAQAYKSSAHSNGRSYGVYAVAGNCSSGFNYAVYGTLSGTNSGYAGYFDGLVRTTNDNPEKPSAGSWTGYSDQRLKNDVNDFADGLDVIRQITPVTYRFNGVGGIQDTTMHVGVIAQDVESIAPYCVGRSQIVVSATEAGPFMSDVVAMVNDSAPEYVVNVYNYNPDGIFYAMINAIKELDSIVTQLQNTTTPVRSSDSLPDSRNLPVQTIALSQSNAILYQNNPNPVTDKTQIHYFLPENASNAEMIFFNQFGQEIGRTTLTNKGNAVLDVDVLSISAGVYTYSMIVDGRVIDTKQFIRAR